MLHALTEPPKSRLGSVVEAQQWLDSVVASFASSVGQAVPSRVSSEPVCGAGDSSVAVGGGGVVEAWPEEPPSPLDTVRVLLAIRLKQDLASITPNTKIKV